MNRALIVSSDGHVCAHMEDYHDYLEDEYLEAFDEFLPVFREQGEMVTDISTVQRSRGDVVAAAYQKEVVEVGTVEGYWDVHHRLEVLDAQGIAAEVLFPDFATPFNLYHPARTVLSGDAPTPLHLIAAGHRAYTRWLVDFCSAAPERFAGLACVDFANPETAVKEIRWARDRGLKGVLVPRVPYERPLYQDHYEPIWDVLEKLEMPLNAHVAISNQLPTYPSPPNPTVSFALALPGIFWNSHELMRLLIWGGVLERHPKLKIVATEQQSDWVVGMLRKMDFSYRVASQAIKDIVPLHPRDYWERQCFLGSSIFSRAEIEAREEIGINKMMLGMDFPHLEGTWWLGTERYLQATLGAAGVCADEAATMLGETAINVFGFDKKRLQQIAARIGSDMTEVLKPLAVDEHPQVWYSDINRPLVFGT